jgi:hypothetical protein
MAKTPSGRRTNLIEALTLFFKPLIHQNRASTPVSLRDAVSPRCLGVWPDTACMVSRRPTAGKFQYLFRSTELKRRRRHHPAAARETSVLPKLADRHFAKISDGQDAERKIPSQLWLIEVWKVVKELEGASRSNALSPLEKASASKPAGSSWKAESRSNPSQTQRKSAARTFHPENECPVRIPLSNPPRGRGLTGGRPVDAPSIIHRAMRWPLRRRQRIRVLHRGRPRRLHPMRRREAAAARSNRRTYSLIDDPPRSTTTTSARQATCHKISGEAIAILAGTLLTCAFKVLASVSTVPLDRRALWYKACTRHRHLPRHGRWTDRRPGGEHQARAELLETIHRAKTARSSAPACESAPRPDR